MAKKTKPGDQYVCGICGLEIVCVEGCGCNVEPIVCCGKAMRQKAPKKGKKVSKKTLATKRAKPKKTAAKRKPTKKKTARRKTAKKKAAKKTSTRKKTTKKKSAKKSSRVTKKK